AKLFSIAKANNANTIWIESVEELPDVSKYESIGLIAGASTPIELTEEVLSKMIQDAKDNAVVLEQQNDQAVEQTNTQVLAEQTAELTPDHVETEQELFTKAVEKLDKGPRQFKKGQKVKGEVVQIAQDGVYVSLGTKKEAIIPNDQLSLSDDYEAVKASMNIGDRVECIVISTDKGVTLSKKEIDELYKDDEQVEGIKQGNRFEVTIKSDVKGGLLAKLGSFTVFVPASHIKIGFVNDLKQYVGKKMALVALPDGIDEAKRKIVASHRIILEREKQEREDNFWNNIEVGEIVEGKVLRYASFGVFVNVRGMDCLAHLSDLSWTPIKTPDEVLEIGRTYEFAVLKLDRESNRISIGYKQLQPHPWQIASEKYTAGTVVKGKVARILPYGAFVELGDGIDGLLHISNISWDWLADITKAVQIGDELELQVIECDAENKRITLSRKALLTPPEVPAEKPADAEAVEEAKEEAPVEA
ncbi:MAG: S1 RNA-binding domain-containing protein, partial [Paludibacteraceae bacterium]|nr:S1 RNA-binding domain-containing protein [Paludibacteraceae bacterium]